MPRYWIPSAIIGPLACFALFALSGRLSAALPPAPTDDPTQATTALFDAMRDGDIARIRGVYTDRAWRSITEDLPPELVTLFAQRVKKRMSAMTAANILESSVQGDHAVVTALLKEKPADETVRITLAKTPEGWRIDYRDNTEGPFVLDDFLCVHLVWNAAYRRTEHLTDPAKWYEQVIRGTQRAEALADARPQSVTVMVTAAEAYIGKLSSSPNAAYASERMRRESMLSSDPDAAAKLDNSMRHRPLLDAKGHLLPVISEEFAHLRRYDTKENGGFPFGLHPKAIAYDYFERAHILQVAGHEHFSLSGDILSLRPAQALTGWAKQEWSFGRQKELQAIGQTIPPDRMAMEAPTSDLAAISKPTKPALLADAIWCYRRAALLCADATTEYERHIRDFPRGQGIADFHVQELAATAASAAADADCLLSLRSEGAERLTARAAAVKGYNQARIRWMRLELRYGAFDKPLAAVWPDFAKSRDRTPLNSMTDAELSKLFKAFNQYVLDKNDRDAIEELAESNAYVNRIEKRLGSLEK